MFRIKNVRNSTVAKQNNIPQINHPIPPQITQNQQRKLPQKNPTVLKPKVQLTKKNEKPKLIIPESQRNMVANSRIIPKKKDYQKISNNKNPNQDEKIANKFQMVQMDNKERVKNSQKVLPTIDVEPKIDPPKQQVKIESNKAIIQVKQEKEQQKIKDQKLAQRKRQQAEQLAERQRRKQQIRQKQQQQSRKNQQRLKEMMQKVNARRRAREQSKQNRLRLQMERQKQPVGAIMALSDPLAHVEMSEAVMDAQINRILTMKFANYPNKQAIERQVEQLQRINRSYLMVRTDPTNTLNRGLSNFRIELFNRVGELIMEAQTQLGPSASGLQVIQSDSRNYPQIKGMQVTRGLEGHLQMLKKVALRQEQECAICLGQIQKGKIIYDVECGHKFHSNCLQDWLNTNANCPACRYNIKFGHH